MTGMTGMTGSTVQCVRCMPLRSWCLSTKCPRSSTVSQLISAPALTADLCGNVWQCVAMCGIWRFAPYACGLCLFVASLWPLCGLFGKKVRKNPKGKKRKLIAGPRYLRHIPWLAQQDNWWQLISCGRLVQTLWHQIATAFVSPRVAIMEKYGEGDVWNQKFRCWKVLGSRQTNWDLILLPEPKFQIRRGVRTEHFEEAERTDSTSYEAKRR